MDTITLLMTTDIADLFGATSKISGEGWEGFRDYRFLADFISRLLLASVLAAIIAYHPKSRRQVENLEAAEAPKCFILYAVVAAIIGTVVLKFGGIVGFVVFGIGGLLRFRTNVGSATATGRVILATVIGLCAGLDLPHVAILSTLFAFILVWMVDSHTTYSMNVQGLSKGFLSEAATAYRQELERNGFRILGERKNLQKHSFRLIFSGPSHKHCDEIEEALHQQIKEKYFGTIDWDSQ
jgi:uncharacterized membrane protein YhiD involved in acid resistance